MITTLHLFTIHLFFSFQTLSGKMDISTNSQSCSHNSKENIPPSSKADPLQVRRAKERTVLGMLSENEQHGPSHSQVGKKSKVDRMSCLSVNMFSLYNIIFHFLPQGSQFSKHSSISDSSQLAFFIAPSSSDYDVCVEEAHEVVLAASGQEVVSGGCVLDTKTSALQNEDVRLLLELSSCEFGPSKTFHHVFLVLLQIVIHSYRFVPGYLRGVWWIPDVGEGATNLWLYRGHSPTLEKEWSEKRPELWISTLVLLKINPLLLLANPSWQLAFFCNVR